jgi:4-amino-4-deoxy-L-arabinose transferase-like glycosyltransferase
MPGYPFFLSVVYWPFGSEPGNLLAVRIVQVLLSVLTIGVLYRLALRLQGWRLGVTVVLLAGLYPPFTLANQEILTEVLYTFFLYLGLLLGVRLLEKTTWVNALLFGVLLAVAAYVRPSGALWAVAPFLLLLRRVPFRRVAALGAVALVAFALCLTPWWVRNERIYDRFVTFTPGAAQAPFLRAPTLCSTDRTRTTTKCGRPSSSGRATSFAR